MPLGATVTAAGANEGQQTGLLLESLVVQPPAALQASSEPDPRSLPSARGDGAYGNGPTRERARVSGFRMRAPSRGQTRRPGIGLIRSAVERGHAWLAQFGRVVRRYDRQTRRYLGWIELAACIIFIRSGLTAPPG